MYQSVDEERAQTPVFLHSVQRSSSRRTEKLIVVFAAVRASHALPQVLPPQQRAHSPFVQVTFAAVAGWSAVRPSSKNNHVTSLDEQSRAKRYAAIKKIVAESQEIAALVNTTLESDSKFFNAIENGNVRKARKEASDEADGFGEVDIADADELFAPGGPAPPRHVPPRPRGSKHGRRG